ncbi:MAG: aminotransferase class I/II-fold pyridoxal phosphate-dependent enzyme [Myxococcales bacterium]|nr:aminotransferase class I/II-fold pyridoxal phosphate-dependent enzyme [Myxococcales bacterium]
MMSRLGWFLAIGALGASFVAAGVAHAQVPAPVRLTLNENPFGPSPIVMKALAEDLGGLFRYVGDEAAAVTKQIATFEGVSPDQVVLGEMLDALGLQLSLQGGPGGEFVYSVPGYAALVDAAARVGGIVVGVPLNAQLENDLPAIAATLNTRTRAVFLINPHNPSGTVNDAATFLEFVRKTSKQTLVIVDEAYLEFDADYPRRTAMSLVRAGENVLVFRTFSKAHGLAALPFGYAAAPRALAESLRRQGLGSPRGQNRLTLTAASASLRDPAHLGRVRTQVAAERTKWHALLDGLKLRRTESRANFIFFDAGRPQAEVAKVLLAEGVAIGRPFAPYQTWVRISIGLPEENARAQAAVRRLFSPGAQ